MEHLIELIKNRTYNIIICCNPDYRKKLIENYFCGFDSYYCSHYCRGLAFHYISSYWKKLIN